MAAPILATKLYIPQPRPGAVARARLLERLNAGLRQNEGFARKLTLISAPAGFGKTALLAEWAADLSRTDPQLRVAWLSLDERDGDPARFLAYLAAAILTVAPDLDAGVLPSLRAPHPPQFEPMLTALLNEIAGLPSRIALVLDDFHLLDSQPVDRVLAFLVDHLPPQLHLALATREDPGLPLARLRGQGQLVELRAGDLRFTPAEAAEFLNRAMRLDLPAEDIAALEERTEGWVAGLQLAALALQGTPPLSTGPASVDRARFIASFTGGHRFVLDYLLQEVLEGQPSDVQTFLLRTSILDRMCGPLCEAVVYPERGDGERPGPATEASGQAMLEHLERSNLFVVPLDNARRWYRYHHLFAELLRQRLEQSLAASTSAGGRSGAELHCRASQWYEDHGLQVEAFRHAAAAHDIERAERLIKAGEIPLHTRAAVAAIINWLDSLAKTALDARPWLWVRSGVSMLMAGQTTGVEEKLQAAEAALALAGRSADADGEARDLVGQIASVRATLAVIRYDPAVAIVESRRALDHLHPDNSASRTRAIWALGFAHQLQGDRVAARQVYNEAVAIRQKPGDIYFTIMATTGLAQVLESDNQFSEAAESYRRSLQLFGDQEPPNASEEFIGLARICYEWNDLDAAEQYGRQSAALARQYDRVLDRFIYGEVLQARVKLARGDLVAAAAMLAESEQSARQNNYERRLPEIAEVQVLVHLRLGQVATAAQLVRPYNLPLSRARVLLAQAEPSAALAVVAAYRQYVEARGWADERLKAMVLQALALRACGEKDEALRLFGDALASAEPRGFIRTFVDEGAPMAELLSEASRKGIRPGYAGKLLAAFPPLPEDAQRGIARSPVVAAAGPRAVLEPLTQRELDILRLMSQGLSNQEIGARLFLSVNTVKGHNRVLFDKLQVERRTEAIARARDLGLL
jgi:LuxR family maltose regulon positive regulatory protein